ncbi:hypothetical protein Droror1_Dr00019906 [Drosera rotundifolia]
MMQCSGPLSTSICGIRSISKNPQDPASQNAQMQLLSQPQSPLLNLNLKCSRIFQGNHQQPSSSSQAQTTNHMSQSNQGQTILQEFASTSFELLRSTSNTQQQPCEI